MTDKDRDVIVIVASHKDYPMPKDKMYLPVFVGSYGKDNIKGFARDDSGSNISKKNPYFCELTGLYWAWKNLKNDYVGMAHYRRFLTTHSHVGGDTKKRLDKVLNSEEANKLLNKCDVILPKKRNYYIENLYDQYKHTMYVEPLDITRNIIAEKYPEYLEEFDKLHTRKSAHLFNVFIMKREILDKYCAWLFDILFELEKRVDPSKYDDFHKRFYGRISERLLDVYLNTNGIRYVETNLLYVEPVNWVKKGSSFLVAKLFGRKYEKSF